MDFFKSLSLVLGVLSGFTAILLTIAGGGDGIWEHEGQIRVERSKERVFEVLTKPEYRKRWVEGLVESKIAPDDELSTEARLEEVVMVDGVRQVRVMKITSFEQDSLITFQYTEGEVQVEMHYAVELFRSSGKCTVKYDCTAQYPGLQAKVIEPILGHMREGLIEADLERLKAVSEEGF